MKVRDMIGYLARFLSNNHRNMCSNISTLDLENKNVKGIKDEIKDMMGYNFKNESHNIKMNFMQILLCFTFLLF